MHLLLSHDLVARMRCVGRVASKQMLGLGFRPWVRSIVEWIDGALEHEYHESGTWTEADGVITKIHYPWDDEAERYSDQLHRVPKHYSWGDAEGTILLMNRWQDDESIDELVVHRRVSDPVPSNL